MKHISPTSVKFSKVLPKNKLKHSFDDLLRILSEVRTNCVIGRGDVVVRSGDLYEIPIELEEVNKGISRPDGMMKITIEETDSEYEFICEIDGLEPRYALHVAIGEHNNRSLEIQKKFYSLMNKRYDLVASPEELS